MVFFHNILIFVVIALGFDIWPGWLVWLALVGLIVLILNAVWVGVLLGLISARFRDVFLITDKGRSRDSTTIGFDIKTMIVF